MNEKLTKTLATFAVLLMLSMAIPVTSAQQQPGTTQGVLDLKGATVSPANLKADITVGTISIPWTYDVDQAGFGLQADVKSTATMKWDDPNCDKAGVVITGPLSNIVSVTRDTSGKAAAAGTKTFNVQATQDAPGETAIKCTFAAEVGALGSQVTKTDKLEVSAIMVVDFLGLLSANLPGTIKTSGPQKEINYAIELSNLGNARATIRFDLLTESAGSWSPVTPTEIILDSPNQGGAETSKTVNFQVSTPHKNGWNNDQKTFQLRITPVSTKSPDIEGTPVTVNVLSRVRGVYVPTLEPMIMLGAILGSAFVAARLRRDE